jgi:HAD superfamily hydrolase (TIGR01458 family)
MAGDDAGPAVLLDIDGVLHVGDRPIEGAARALAQLREIGGGVRLLTNTTSRSRRQIVAELGRLGFELDAQEVLTPAALAVRYCRERGHRSVALLVGEALREDLLELEQVSGDTAVDAVVIGDLGDGFTAPVLNRAFRQLLDGAELVALQHNRYWQRGDGLVLDVGAYAAALEYGAGKEAVVVGKPAAAFFMAALADLDARPVDAVMVGDDIEADVGGAIACGIQGVLVRTGKYREEIADGSAVRPTAVVDSIADVPELVSRMGG